MSNLKKQIISSFPGKMENKDAFFMQFVMELVQKGEKPPPKEELEKCITELVAEGVFREKGGLLIYNRKDKEVYSEDQEILSESPPLSDLTSLSNIQKEIMSMFKGKFENKTALMMNVSVQAATRGSPPPSKEELNEAINDLLDKQILEEKGDILIKKN